MEQGKDEKMNKKRANFTGTIGFVMAAAGSAVGLGNIWRFPYLAAKDHGGVFILCYLILAVTFGFTLLTTEIAIGRKTGRSPLTAYAAIQPKWKGHLAILLRDRWMGCKIFRNLCHRCRISGSGRRLFCGIYSRTISTDHLDVYFLYNDSVRCV